MAKDDPVASGEDNGYEQSASKDSNDAAKLDREVSSEMSGDGAAFEDADDVDALVEDGFDIETHGGGRLEAVSEFDINRPLTEGFGSEFVEIEEDLANIPPNCQLEYEEPETVCGRDDRRRISPASAIPWRMICQLIIERGDGRTSRCTGWFIGPKTVMTAGHCVYSHSIKKWARKITVIPGMDASNRPYGALAGTSFRSVRGWTSRPDPNYDYGCIILPNETLGRRVGWWGFAALSDGSLKNLLVNNSGYPGDKPFGTQWFNAGRINRITSRRLYYMLDTAGGQSGSPTWRLKGGKRHAVGIHAYGGCPNKSTRINRAVFENMKRWKNVS